MSLTWAGSRSFWTKIEDSAYLSVPKWEKKAGIIEDNPRSLLMRCIPFFLGSNFRFVILWIKSPFFDYYCLFDCLVSGC